MSKYIDLTEADPDIYNMFVLIDTQQMLFHKYHCGMQTGEQLRPPDSRNIGNGFHPVPAEIYEKNIHPCLFISDSKLVWPRIWVFYPVRKDYARLPK